jgi:hypothetical protein
MSICPSCGNQMNYIQQYGQWFCYYCQRYQSPVYQPTIAHQQTYRQLNQQYPTSQYPTQSPSYQQQDSNRSPASQTKSKKGKKIGTIIALVVIVAIVFTAIIFFAVLTKESDDEILIGSWRHYDSDLDVETIYTFRENGTGTLAYSMSTSDLTVNFTWSFDEVDKELSITMSGMTLTFDYEFVDENRLRLSYLGGEETTFTRV